jgi:Protein of unknown function (DUF3429)
MTPQKIALSKILTYSGTLPIIGCAIAMSLKVNVSFIAYTYCAVIISFLCGIHWSIYLFFSGKCPTNLLITSNLTTLIAWLFLFIPHQGIFLLLQPFCFLYLLMLDHSLRDAGILPAWFYYLRRNATLVVVLCLSMIAIVA